VVGPKKERREVQSLHFVDILCITCGSSGVAGGPFLRVIILAEANHIGGSRKLTLTILGTGNSRLSQGSTSQPLSVNMMENTTVLVQSSTVPAQEFAPSGSPWMANLPWHVQRAGE